jgi:hypothetical protein
MQAIAIGGPINFLNQYEQNKTNNANRPWDAWKKEAGDG